MARIHEHCGWDDLRFPFTRDRLGVADKPDYDFTEHGLLFPQNDATEIIHISDQMPHRWKIGSSVRPHLHFVQDEAQVSVWKIDYRWYDNEGDPTVAFASGVANTGFAFTYSSGSILQIATWAAIDLSAISGLSAFFDIRVYRDDNVVAGDILGKGFDIHYIHDSIGSAEEYVK